jgi:hypothetical protein
MKLDTVEIPAGVWIHYSGLEGGVSFACKQERVKGDYWSQYQMHVTCPKCLEYIAAERKVIPE